MRSCSTHLQAGFEVRNNNLSLLFLNKAPCQDPPSWFFKGSFTLKVFPKCMTIWEWHCISVVVIPSPGSCLLKQWINNRLTCSKPTIKQHRVTNYGEPPLGNPHLCVVSEHFLSELHVLQARSKTCQTLWFCLSRLKFCFWDPKPCTGIDWWHPYLFLQCSEITGYPTMPGVPGAIWCWYLLLLC